jgi:anterior pharynx defective protein 1
MGLKDGSDLFFLTSAATALCFILLHTFWSIIFFSGMDDRNYLHIAWVIGTHMIVSCLTLLNQNEQYLASLLPGYCIMLVTGCMAYRVAGGTFHSFVASLKCY